MWWFCRVSEEGGRERRVGAVGYLQVDWQDCVENCAVLAVVECALRLFRAAYTRRK